MVGLLLGFVNLWLGGVVCSVAIIIIVVKKGQGENTRAKAL